MSSPVVHIERIEYVTHNHVDMGEVLGKLNHLIQHQHEIMALIDDLKVQVADLKQQTTELQALTLSNLRSQHCLKQMPQPLPPLTSK
jgi:hypothetical protein